jgi:hypothetical protein
MICDKIYRGVSLHTILTGNIKPILYGIGRGAVWLNRDKKMGVVEGGSRVNAYLGALMAHHSHIQRA